MLKEKRALSKQLQRVKEVLQATDMQMANRLKIGLDTYKALETGARNLPMPARRAIEKRVERLLKICGLELTK